LDSSGNSISSSDNPAVSLADRFGRLGGVFLTPPEALAERLAKVEAMAFDWDGVFNAGAKSETSTSTFSEADSMGANLLRYALWRRGGRLPACTIITGEHNPSARRFAMREHFDSIFEGVRNKAGAMEEFCSGQGVERGELLCVFDDVNDLAMAAGCGCRFLVRREASVLFQDYVRRNTLADYITASAGGDYAVREIAELSLGLLGAFDDVVESRLSCDARYSAYLAARNAVSTNLAR
jgi:3-deoxy-D-manno-octulosonate 8-phosphate phosphatase (KDO 8-P phosphatase)